jgi:hypothetical protein
MTQCRSYLFLTKKKLLPHISGIRIVGGKLHSTPWLALAIQLTNVSSVPVEEHNNI